MLTAEEAAERFWPRVDTSGGPGACHPWTGRLDKDGYGLSGHGPRAHRVAFEQGSGRSLASRDVVRHGDDCVTRACCNYAHLSVGTQADNIADRDRLGRTQKGARHWKARLTESQIIAIRARCSAGDSATAIATDFGVGPEAIRKIRRGENWKHVQPEPSPLETGL